jgi:hypothetical protein
MGGGGAGLVASATAAAGFGSLTGAFGSVVGAFGSLAGGLVIAALARASNVAASETRLGVATGSSLGARGGRTPAPVAIGVAIAAAAVAEAARSGGGASVGGGGGGGGAGAGGGGGRRAASGAAVGLLERRPNTALSGVRVSLDRLGGAACGWFEITADRDRSGAAASPRCDRCGAKPTGIIANRLCDARIDSPSCHRRDLAAAAFAPCVGCCMLKICPSRRKENG